MGQQAGSCKCSPCAVDAVRLPNANDNVVEWGPGSSSLLRRGIATETERATLKFPMYVIKVEELMKLKFMVKHEVLKSQGKLCKVPRNGVVHFISHQWIGNTHPDPRGVQLRRLQDVLAQALLGKTRSLLSDDDWPTFTRGTVATNTAQAQAIQDAQLQLRDAEFCETRDYSKYVDADFVEDFRIDVAEGYVWLDYFSIPQAVEIDGVIADQLSAVRSIPAYAERANHFWIVCPNELHADTGSRVNFQTWASRGWCRLEEWSNFIGEHAKTCLIVSDAPLLQTKCFMDFTLQNLIPGHGSPFHGAFSCCRMNHQVNVASGQLIPCDRQVVATVIKGLIDARWRRLENAPPLVRNFMKMMNFGIARAGLEGTEYQSEYALDETETEEELMTKMRCSDVPFEDLFEFALMGSSKIFARFVKKEPMFLNSLIIRGSSTPLMFLCRFGSQRVADYVSVVPDLAKTVNITSPNGRTALDVAAWCGHADIVAQLLEFRADFNTVRGDTGRTPLLTAAFQGHYMVCATLLEARADPKTTESMSGRTGLHIAAVQELSTAGNQEAKAFFFCCGSVPQSKNEPRDARHIWKDCHRFGTGDKTSRLAGVSRMSFKKRLSNVIGRSQKFGSQDQLED